MKKLGILTISVAIIGMLTGCAGGSDAFSGITPTCDHYEGGTAVDGVSVTLNKTGAPKVDFANSSSGVTFASALSKITKPQTKVITEGTGPAFTGDEVVKLDYAAYSSATGASLGGNAFNGTDAQDIYLASKTYPDLCHGLSGVKQGSVVALAVPANTQNPGGSLYVFNVVKVSLPHANGDVQAPASGLPQVVRDPKTGRPGLVTPSFDAPKGFQSAVLIAGRGAEVKATDTVTIQYSLWDWTGKLGSTLESSWDSQPLTLNLATGSIKGLAMALTGVKVGSQVIASIPPEDAYGATGQGSVQANATLLFVIDVLGTDK